MYILGINAYHGDASAAIIKDGQLIAAAEEERFNRKKHCAGFPAAAIQYCLDAAEIKDPTWIMSLSPVTLRLTCIRRFSSLSAVSPVYRA